LLGGLHRRRFLFMVEAASGALIRLADTLEKLAPLLGRAGDMVMLGHPIGYLLSGPSPISLRNEALYGTEDLLGNGGALAGVGPIIQRIETASKIGFDPVANGLVVHSEMRSDPWNGPSGIGEAHHLQSISRSRGQSGQSRPPDKFQARRVIKINVVQGVKLTSTSLYEKTKADYLGAADIDALPPLIVRT
jgi:hypothetical protein